MRSRILVGLICGTIGGFLGWLLQENLLNYNAYIGGSMPPHASRTLAFCVGGLTGLFLGVVDGIVEGSPRKLGRGLAIGLAGGILLGYIGFYIGNIIYNVLGGTSDGSTAGNMFGFAKQVIARSFGWAGLGLGLGIGSGLATMSPKRIWQGAVGGFLGGFIGGFVFDLLANSATPLHTMGSSGTVDVGGQSRMVGFTAIGGLTGFFIGLVEELMKQAWVKVLAGKNEGKDFILSKAMSILGRDERADVPLYGDMNVAPQHAAIRAERSRHTLIDAGTQLGTVVNGQRVAPGSELLLRDGDMIQVGAHRILFREKATAAKFARDPVDAPKGKSAGPANVPMPSHLCPFCGAAKDPSGKCLCSVAGAPSGVPGASMATSPGWASDAGLPPMGTAYGGGMPAESSAYPTPVGYGAVSAGGVIMPRLVGMEGPYTGQVFLLTNMTNIIGREPDKDIVLSADTTTSRNHARIVNEGGDFVVYDNGSANGTFVNSLRISMQVLAPGDIVQFGASKFRFE